MNNDQNIVHIRNQNSITQDQIDNFTIKAHKLRSSAFSEFFSTLFSKFAGIYQRYLRYRKHRKAFAELSVLDDRLLRDIGLYRSDLQRFGMGQAGVQQLINERQLSRSVKTVQYQAKTLIDHIPAANETSHQVKVCAAQ